MTGDNVYYRPDGARRCRACQRYRHALPVYVEAQRIRQQGYRLARGVQPRDLQRGVPRERQETIELPVEPFGRWLRDLKDSVGYKRVAVLTWLHPRQVDAYISGERSSVHIDTVDAALMHEGSTFLWELYPALYDFEDEAVAA